MNDLDKPHGPVPDTRSTVPMSSTFCMNCIFAQFDETSTQIGCKANRLELFKKAGIPISTTPEDSPSYIIEGKACVYYRNKEWGNEYYKNIDEDNLVSTVRQELKIPYHAIIFFRSHNTIDELQQRLSELHNQAVSPKLVTVIDFYTNSPDFIKPVTAQTLLSQNSLLSMGKHVEEPHMSRKLIECFQPYQFAHWRIQTPQYFSDPDRTIIDLVYDNTKKIQYLFYISFENSYPIPADFSHELHVAVHDKMQAFTVLLPNAQNNGGGALKVAHAKHTGNSFTIPLEEKIKHYDDAPHLIKKVEDICPSFQTS